MQKKCKSAKSKKVQFFSDREKTALKVTINRTKSYLNLQKRKIIIGKNPCYAHALTMTAHAVPPYPVLYPSDLPLTYSLVSS